MEESKKQPRYLTPEEVTERFGLPASTLRNMRSRGHKDPIPYVMFSDKVVRYREDHLEEWEARNTFLTADQPFLEEQQPAEAENEEVRSA